MATVRLSDVVIPSVYMSYSALNSPELTAFYESGIIATSDVMNQIARDGGKFAVLPFWNDLDTTDEPNYSNDDPDDKATPDKVGTGTMTGRKAWLNKGYSDMDIVQELAGASPMQHIRNRFGVWWTRQFSKRLIASAVGILADNVANDGGDMLIDISGAAGTDALFNSDAFIDAAYTSGDHAEGFGAIGVHSAVMARMVKNDDIVYIPDSQGKLTIPTYKGRRVVVDDNMPKTGTGANSVYTSILFGGNSFGFGAVDGSAFAVGEGQPRVPVEVDRDPRAGNGGGMEEIWERKTWILHPFGYEWVESTGTPLASGEFSPTLSDLASATHWNRVVSRKQVPLAFIKSKA